MWLNHWYLPPVWTRSKTVSVGLYKGKYQKAFVDIQMHFEGFCQWNLSLCWLYWFEMLLRAFRIKWQVHIDYLLTCFKQVLHAPRLVWECKTWFEATKSQVTQALKKVVNCIRQLIPSSLRRMYEKHTLREVPVILDTTQVVLQVSQIVCFTVTHLFLNNRKRKSGYCWPTVGKLYLQKTD